MVNPTALPYTLPTSYCKMSHTDASYFMIYSLSALEAFKTTLLMTTLTLIQVLISAISASGQSMIQFQGIY